MPHYKAPDNSLHFLDDPAYEHLLPAGSVPISDEDAEALRPIPTVDPEEEARTYLNATDWYVVRFAETGVPIPDDVKQRRAAARLLLP